MTALTLPASALPGARGRFAVYLVAASAVLLAGCGSGGGAGASTTSQDQLAKARQFVAKAEIPASKIPITQPLKAKPTPGKTVVYMECDAPSCADFAAALKEATGAVGWRLRSIPFKNADPSTLISALKQALRYSPVATIVPGADPRLWAPATADYERANVPIITLSMTGVPELESGTVPIQSAPWNVRQGEAQANFVIDDSRGEARILLVTIPSYPLFRTMTGSFTRTVRSGCAGCSVTTLDVTIPQLANMQVNPAVIAKLRTDPRIDYVVSQSGDILLDLTSQLRANGLAGRVKVFEALAHPQTTARIIKGDTTGSTNQAEYTVAWMGLDAALRIAEGTPLPKREYANGPAVQLLSKNNVKESRGSSSWDSPTDYAAQFKKLWRLS